MQMLDQEIAALLRCPDQRAHFGARLRIDLAPFWRARRPATATCELVVDECHRRASYSSPQNRPVMRPSAPTSIVSAAGTLGSPGMVMISPQIATTNSAPAESRTSRTLMVWSLGAPFKSALVENEYCVLAMQTGALP